MYKKTQCFKIALICIDIPTSDSNGNQDRYCNDVSMISSTINESEMAAQASSRGRAGDRKWILFSVI